MSNFLVIKGITKKTQRKTERERKLFTYRYKFTSIELE
jgi:hypothetical protein